MQEKRQKVDRCTVGIIAKKLTLVQIVEAEAQAKKLRQKIDANQKKKCPPPPLTSRPHRPSGDVHG